MLNLKLTEDEPAEMQILGEESNKENVRFQKHPCYDKFLYLNYEKEVTLIY